MNELEWAQTVAAEEEWLYEQRKEREKDEEKASHKPSFCGNGYGFAPSSKPDSN